MNSHYSEELDLTCYEKFSDEENFAGKENFTGKENVSGKENLPEPSSKKAKTESKQTFARAENLKTLTQVVEEALVCQKVNELRIHLRYQDLRQLLGALWASMRTVRVKDDNPLIKYIVRKPAALNHLKRILENLCDIFLKDLVVIHKYLENSLDLSVTQNNEHVIMLADILLTFKKAVFNTGLLADKAAIFEKSALFSAALKNDYNWIIYFNHVIHVGLEKMNADDDTRLFLSTLTYMVKTLQDLTYKSIQKNFPAMSRLYTDLENKMPAIGATNRNRLFQYTQQQEKNFPTASKSHAQIVLKGR